MSTQNVSSDPVLNAAVNGDDIVGTGTITGTEAAKAKKRVKSVKFNSIKLDLDRNPRLPGEAYKPSKIGWLARSIFQHGMLEMPTVSQRADGSLWLLKGHLRCMAVKLVRTEGIKAGNPASEFPAIEANPHFMDDIDVIVLTGLTPAEELDLVMDHGMVTKLNKRERYRAGKELRKMGWTQEATAQKLGMSRPAFQKLDAVMRMPQCVEDAYLADPDDKDAKHINETLINSLYAAYNEDKKSNGFRPKQFGPKSLLVWEDFLKNGVPQRDKAFSADKMKEKAEFEDDHDLQDLFMAIANGKDDDFNAAVARIHLRLVPFGQIVPPAEPVDDLNATVIEEEETAEV